MLLYLNFFRFFHSDHVLLWQADWLLGFYCLFRNRSQGSDHNENFIQFLPASALMGRGCDLPLMKDSPGWEQSREQGRDHPWCLTLVLPLAPISHLSCCFSSTEFFSSVWVWRSLSLSGKKNEQTMIILAQVTGGSCPVANISPLLSCPGPALHAQPQRGVTTSSNKKTIWKSEEPRALWMI